MPPWTSLRRLAPAEAPLYRALRLEGLADTPEAFGTTLAIESARRPEAFVHRLEQTAVFAACNGDHLLGMAGYARETGPKMQHKGVLWGMYVKPQARGTGAAPALVQAVLAHARTEVEQVLLTVIAGNTAARRLYKNQGFIEYGLEPRALQQDGTYYDEVLMLNFLNNK